MTEMEIEERMSEICNEYSQLKELDRYSLTLEALGDNGDISVTMEDGVYKIERVIGITEPLDFISSTFRYDEYLTPTTADISLNRLKRAYFDNLGRLMVERDSYFPAFPGGTSEVFRVRSAHKGRVKAILKERLGNKFKS